MILPPLVVNLRIRETDTHGFRMWLPVFLLWPLLLVVLVLALAVSILVDAMRFLTGRRYHHFTLLLLNSLRILAEIRGTHAHIKNATQLVDVDIY